MSHSSCMPSHMALAHSKTGMASSPAAERQRCHARAQVRVRCVGAEGAGHSDWSSPVSVDTPPVPGLHASERPSATVASQVGSTLRHAMKRPSALQAAGHGFWQERIRHSAQMHFRESCAAGSKDFSGGDRGRRRWPHLRAAEGPQSARGRDGAGRPRAAARKSLTPAVREVGRWQVTPLHPSVVFGWHPCQIPASEHLCCRTRDLNRRLRLHADIPGAGQ